MPLPTLINEVNTHKNPMQFGLNIFVNGLLAILTLQLMACSADYAEMAQDRLEFARKQKGDIEIAVIKNPGRPNYFRGVKLAAEEINQRPNKLLGRSIHLHTEEEEYTIEESMPSIKRIASNPRIVAVLGHALSTVAIPASVIYERSQVIFMPSFATSDVLTGHGFQYVFRMTPSTRILSKQQASMAKLLGYKSMILLYERKPVSKELAFFFEEAAIENDIEILQRASFFGGTDRNYRPIISQFNSESFDAIYLASGLDAGAQMARQLREMGLDQPIIGSDSLPLPAYYRMAGKEGSNKTIVPSLYKATDSVMDRYFVKKYTEKYKEPPNHEAAQGYDSMNLLAHGITLGRSTLGPTLSSALHYMPAWAGVTGIHAFDEDGELRGKKNFFQVWHQGKLLDLPVIHQFYLLDRFVQRLKEKYGDDYPISNFSEVFKQRMHEDDRKFYLLDLAHELIRFKSIGIIYENTQEGRKQAQYDLLERLADKKGIEIVECNVPFSVLNAKEIKTRLIDCYGHLSLKMEALLVPDYYRSTSKPNIINQLNKALGFYKIPSILINENSDIEYVSVKFTKRGNIKLEMPAYNGLLKDLEMHQLYEQLSDLPKIHVSLGDLQQGDFPDEPILDISSDHYLNFSNAPDGPPN